MDAITKQLIDEAEAYYKQARHMAERNKLPQADQLRRLAEDKFDQAYARLGMELIQEKEKVTA